MPASIEHIFYNEDASQRYSTSGRTSGRQDTNSRERPADEIVDRQETAQEEEESHASQINARGRQEGAHAGNKVRGNAARM